MEKRKANVERPCQDDCQWLKLAQMEWTPPSGDMGQGVPWFGTVCQDVHRPIEAFVAKTFGH